MTKEPKIDYVNRASKISPVDKAYIKSDCWRCSNSPTGAHHWVITPIKHGKIMNCKYCRQQVKLPVSELPEFKLPTKMMGIG